MSASKPEASGEETELEGRADEVEESQRQGQRVPWEPPTIVLDPDDEAELERALDEADDDLAHGRHVPRDAVFPRARVAG